MTNLTTTDYTWRTSDDIMTTIYIIMYCSCSWWSYDIYWSDVWIVLILYSMLTIAVHSSVIIHKMMKRFKCIILIVLSCVWGYNAIKDKPWPINHIMILYLNNSFRVVIRYSLKIFKLHLKPIILSLKCKSLLFTESI